MYEVGKMKSQAQIEQELKDRMTFDEALEFFQWQCDALEGKFLLKGLEK